jgi:hypothetical protein
MNPDGRAEGVVGLNMGVDPMATSPVTAVAYVAATVLTV